MNLDNHIYPIRNSAIISQELDDGVVLVDPEKGKVVVLNPVAARIWSLCTGDCSLMRITEIVVGEYDIESEQAEADIRGFMEDLISRGAIILQESHG